MKFGNKNEEKFDTKGSIYSKYRPFYPESVFEYLKIKKIITANSQVADIGSGTGIFTMQLQSFVDTIYAVEPNDDMREKAEITFGKCSNVVSINGSAENTKLLSNSMDCIIVAQAFHWFDQVAFKEECRRILKPSGNIVLLWNRRNENSAIIQRNAQINAMFCDEYKGFSNGMNFDDMHQFDDFLAGGYAVKRFENTIRYDLETFIGRNLSSSFVPKQFQNLNNPYVTALKELFYDFSSDGKYIDYPYIVQCYIGKL